MNYTTRYYDALQNAISQVGMKIGVPTAEWWSIHFANANAALYHGEAEVIKRRRDNHIMGSIKMDIKSYSFPLKSITVSNIRLNGIMSGKDVQAFYAAIAEHGKYCKGGEYKFNPLSFEKFCEAIEYYAQSLKRKERIKKTVKLLMEHVEEGDDK